MPDRILSPAFLLVMFAALAAHGCSKSQQGDHAQQMAARVRTEFLHAWNNYERHAWGHDALRPLSKTARD
ncbi:MAG: glycoside hydrolase family 47 protein, partial [Verrucomicrobia bacterium]|nr:glycoside hydrolase family 47 protein [Verrucomicrobiota bacterium]